MPRSGTVSVEGMGTVVDSRVFKTPTLDHPFLRSWNWNPGLGSKKDRSTHAMRAMSLLLVAGAIVAIALGTVVSTASAQHIQAFLDAHNAERMRTGVPEMRWDDEVAAYSHWWTHHQKNYENCNMKHSDGPYGENLFWGSPGKEWTPHDAVQSWVDEKQHFNYEGNSCAQMCGHYTQLVWRDSAKLGCATAVCPSGETLIACNYDPPGNYIGERPF